MSHLGSNTLCRDGRAIMELDALGRIRILDRWLWCTARGATSRLPASPGRRERASVHFRLIQIRRDRKQIVKAV